MEKKQRSIMGFFPLMLTVAAVTGMLATALSGDRAGVAAAQVGSLPLPSRPCHLGGLVEVNHRQRTAAVIVVLSDGTITIAHGSKTHCFGKGKGCWKKKPRFGPCR